MKVTEENGRKEPMDKMDELTDGRIKQEHIHGRDGWTDFALCRVGGNMKKGGENGRNRNKNARSCSCGRS